MQINRASLRVQSSSGKEGSTYIKLFSSHEEKIFATATDLAVWNYKLQPRLYTTVERNTNGDLRGTPYYLFLQWKKMRRHTIREETLVQVWVCLYLLKDFTSLGVKSGLNSLVILFPNSISHWTWISCLYWLGLPLSEIVSRQHRFHNVIRRIKVYFVL